MIVQSAMSAALAEIVLKSARCGVTKTVTNTSVTLPIKGGPVVLATNTAWSDGTYVIPALTSTSIVNNLLQGVAYDYPELRPNTAGRWAGESQGLVQVYGYAPDAKVQIATSAQAAGLALIPNVNEFISVSGPITAAATSSGLPRRFIATPDVIAAMTLSASGAAATTERSIGVSVGPGQTTLAVTPLRAASRAIVFVNPMTPAFAPA